MRPRFHRLEVVSITALGVEGIVHEYVGPAEDDDGWELLVWAEGPGEPEPVLWVFREDELGLWLGTELTSASQAIAASAEIAAALQALREAPEAVVEFERRHEEPLRLGASWSRAAAAPGGFLLTTAAEHAEVVLMPWSHTRASAAHVRRTLDWPPAG